MEAALQGAISRFSKRNPVSKGLHEEAIKSLPGGNTRTLLHTNPFPVFMRSGEGCYVWDEDGHQYVDFVGGMTAGLFGHSDPAILEALASAACNKIGMGLSSSSVHEQRYARLLCDRFGLDRVRFTNSGTEANLHCLMAARRFTGRNRVVVFRGGYHGGVLSFATGLAPNDVDRNDWILLQYNDIPGVRDAFQRQGKEIAAVLLEGIQGSAGFIPATAAFLEAIREACDQAKSIFILDEVMTSRLAAGGLKSLSSVQPDMVTLGKYLGGGLPFGAFGGRQDVMAVYDPRAPNSLMHSGTFQNSVLMLLTGYTALSQLYPPDTVDAFNEKGDDLRGRLAGALQGTKFSVTGRGSLLCIHATRHGLPAEKIACKDDVLVVDDPNLRKLFWLEMVEHGIWIHERGSIALSLPMTEKDLDMLVQVAKEFCARHRDLVMPEKADVGKDIDTS